jgi:exonuclease SbcC
VCEQVVAAVPDTRGDSPLADLEGALRRASAERQAAEKALAASQGDLKAARASLEAAEKARAGIDVELAASRIEAAETTEKLNRIGEELAGLVGEGDAAVQVERLKGELKTLAESAAQASRRLNVVLGQHNEAIQRQQNAGKEVAAAGMALVEVAAWLGLPAPQIDDSDPTTMTAALDALAAARTERAAALDVELAEARTERDDAESARRALLDELGIEDDFKAALAAEEARAGMLSASVATNRERVETMGALAEQCDSATARLAVFERLVGDLTDSRFIRFLLDDERRRLADLGSDHFQRLSSGRYRFSTDGKFDVVDLTAADAVRRADSLSGGETFLASLGLALALAEMVSRSGGRLEAFFLDEGFGTLDPEHLDLAMEGVELLAAGEGSRLVVVVSHVPELRHRLEDLIVLDKSPLTGDTRVVRS